MLYMYLVIYYTAWDILYVDKFGLWFCVFVVTQSMLYILCSRYNQRTYS